MKITHSPSTNDDRLKPPTLGGTQRMCTSSRIAAPCRHFKHQTTINIRLQSSISLNLELTIKGKCPNYGDQDATHRHDPERSYQSGTMVNLTVQFQKLYSGLFWKNFFWFRFWKIRNIYFAFGKFGCIFSKFNQAENR